MSVLYLVRHGESEANVERVFDGRERPLTERGHRQAEAVAGWLAGRPVAALYASPYRRALETARVIGARVGLEPEVWDGLQEVKVGDLAGRSDEESRTLFGEVYRRWLAGEREARFPGGETLGEACSRLSEFLDLVASRHAGEEVVAVSHGGMPESVLPLILRLPEGAARAVGLAAITTLRLEDGAGWVTEAGSWGALEHLAGLE